MISLPNSNVILLKANNHWSTDDNRHYRFHDWDEMVLLNEDGDSVMCPFVTVDVEQSENDSAYLEERYYSRGNTYDNAHRKASEINYHYTVSDSVITLPNYFEMSTANVYRGQCVDLVLKLPVGKTVKFDKSLGGMLYDVDNITDTRDWYMLGHEWKMSKDGLECLNCPPEEDDEYKEWHSRNHDITIDHGKVTIDKDGKHIEISNGDVKVDSTH